MSTSSVALANQKLYMRYIGKDTLGLGVERIVTKVLLSKFDDGVISYQLSLLHGKLPILMNRVSTEERMLAEVNDYCERHNIQPISSEVGRFLLAMTKLI